MEHAASAVSISSEAIKKQHEEEVALQKLGEQRSQLEVQISQQKEHALRAREEEERELQRLKAEAERLREEEQRHVAEAKRLQEEAAVEVARLQAEAAKRAASTVPQDATPSPDIVA